MTTTPNVFTPSPQQNSFFDWIKDETGSCVLEAVAGSGKTTTLIEALKLMSGSIFFGAYNKKIAEEIKARTTPKIGLTISTMHAAGFAAWRNFTRANLKVDGNKCRDLFRASKAHATHNMFEGPILDLVSYAKQAGVGFLKNINDNSVWMNLIDHFDIDCLENDRDVIIIAKKLLQRSTEVCGSIIDFEDMIYAPLVNKVRFTEYDWVLIDEAQDTNASRRALALSMLKRGGRLIAVGDRHQAIYGFTGADADALDLIASATSAKKLPLTVTYRCPIAVVTYAQQYVSHIKSHPSAPEGKVTYLPPETRLPTAVVPGDAVLCRFNLPLISACYQFIADGIPAKVEGREIGNGLKKLASRWKVKTFTALSDKLDTYLDREVAKYRAKEQESKAALVEDTVECVKILIQRCLKQDTSQDNPVGRLIVEIDKIFGEDVGNDCVVLSSIHKSKGREWNNVLWLQTGPSKWARKEWELNQETNLCYVAATRAKQQLLLIDI
jgi:superfamily I DNA/RNA helicase